MLTDLETQIERLPVSGADPCIVSFVIPARDEEPTIRSVVLACREAATLLDLTSEVIVVSDGSTDGTVQLAKEVGAVVIERSDAPGKAETLWLGVDVSRGDYVFFVDGDLIGLQGRHLVDIARPVLIGTALMSVGTFDYRHGGRLVQRLPWSTGQRIVPRGVFEAINGKGQGYNIELLLNEAVGSVGGSTASQRMVGVTQRNKSDKATRRVGIRQNLVMWSEIATSTAGISRRNYRRYARNVMLFDPRSSECKRQSRFLTHASVFGMGGIARALRFARLR